MFELSFSEMLLAGVVALIVLGPERLPVVARKAGEWMGKIQQLATGVKNEWAQHKEVAQLAQVKNDLQQTANSIKQDLQDFGTQLHNETQEIAHAISPHAWDNLPEQKTPADFGVDETGKPLAHLAKPLAWQSPTLHKQAMNRKRDNRPRHRPTPKLRSRK